MVWAMISASSLKVIPKRSIFRWCLCLPIQGLKAQNDKKQHSPFIVKGFHLDLRVQVMTMDALKAFALKLNGLGINTLIMEWEATYPFEKHPLIPNRYAYPKDEVVSFIK